MDLRTKRVEKDKRKGYRQIEGSQTNRETNKDNTWTEKERGYRQRHERSKGIEKEKRKGHSEKVSRRGS
jgi:hypothetical protein